MTSSEDIPKGTALETEKRAGLQKFLEDSFGLHELKALAFELGTGYETLSRTQKGALIRDLLHYCERRNQFGTLLAEMRRQRPGHPFLALWSATLLAVPRTKVQLTIVEGYDGAFNQREVKEGVAELLELCPEEVVLIAVAAGTTHLLVSLPYRTVPPRIMLGSHKFCRGRYEIIALEPFDALDVSSQQAWRLVALDYPPKRWMSGLQPRVSWREAVQDTGVLTPAPEGPAVTPDRTYTRKLFSLPLFLAALRLPTVACGTTLLVAALLTFICAVLATAFLMRWQGTRVEMSVPATSVEQTQTIATLEATKTTTVPVSTASAEHTLPIVPSPTPSPTRTLTSRPSSTPGPTSTPLRPSPTPTRTVRPLASSRTLSMATPTLETPTLTSVSPVATATRLVSASAPTPTARASARLPTAADVGPVAPRPVAPLDGEQFEGGNLILLKWTWEGELGRDGIYSVRVWPKSEGPTQTCARDHYWRHGLIKGPIREPWYLFSPSDCLGQHTLCWDVHAAVEGEVGWRQLSPYSVPWCFVVGSASS